MTSSTPNTPQGMGNLIFRISTAGGAIPLANARVTVRYRGDENTPMRGNAIAVMLSDRDGKTPMLPLPTTPRNQSQAPRENGTPPPFVCYDAEVSLEGYGDVAFVCIPVFDGVTSIQPVTLIPLPQNGRPDGVSPDGDIIIESQNPNL